MCYSYSAKKDETLGSLQKFLPAHCGPQCVCSRFPGFSRNSYVIFQGMDWSSGGCLVCVDLLCGTEQPRTALDRQAANLGRLSRAG